MNLFKVLWIIISAFFVFGKASFSYAGALSPRCQLLVEDQNQEINFLIKSDFKISKAEQTEFETNKELFAKQLNDQTFLLKKENTTNYIYYSITRGQYVKNWIPLKVSTSDLMSQNQKLSCNKLKEMVLINRFSREATYSAIRYHVEGKPQSLTLGETIIRLELEFARQKKNQNLAATLGVIKKYNSVLNQNKRYAKNIFSEEDFFAAWRFVMESIYSDQKANINYCADKTLMSEALISNCTNCIGETSLFLSLFIDLKFIAPKDWELSVQMFDDHVRPILFNKNKKQVFDLVYGQLSKPTSAILKWQDYMLPLIKGTKLVLSQAEENFIESKEIQYTYTDWFCNNRYKDLGYDNRLQAFDFSYIKSCGRFSNQDLPEGVVDTASRLDGYMSGTQQKASRLASWFGLFNKSPSSAYAKTQEQQEYLRSLELTALREIEQKFLKLKDNLDLKEINLINAAVKTQSLDQLLPTISPKEFINHMGLKDSQIISYETRDFQYLNPIHITCSDLVDVPYVESFYVANFATIPNSMGCKNILTLSTVERYIKIYDILKQNYYLNLRGIEHSFDPKNMIGSFVEQHQNSEKNKKLTILSLSAERLLRYIPIDIIRLDNRNIHMTLVDTVKDRIPFYNEITTVNTLKESFKKGLVDSIVTLNAIKEAQDKLGVNKLELFPYIEDKALSKQSPYSLVVLSEDEILKYYKDFIYNLLLNKKYFFTSLDQKYEEVEYKTLEELIALELVNSNQTRTIKASNLPQINLPKVGLSCGPDDVGLVQKGFLYVECPNKKNEIEKTPNHKENAFDIREMVILEPKYWNTIIGLYGPSFLEDHLLLLALHHAQTEAFVDAFVGYIDYKDLWIAPNVIHPSLKFKTKAKETLTTIEDIINKTNEMNGSRQDLLSNVEKYIQTEALENLENENKTGELLYYQDYPFLKKAVLEARQNLKTNWSEPAQDLSCLVFATLDYQFECQNSLFELRPTDSMKNPNHATGNKVGVFMQ